MMTPNLKGALEFLQRYTGDLQRYATGLQP